MSARVGAEPDLTGQDRVPGRGIGGPAPVRITVAYGFWIFLLSDIILFATLFAAYAVLVPDRAGGPGPRDLFDTNTVAVETVCLLLSSYTCGLGGLAAERGRRGLFAAAFAATFALGVVFLSIEGHEFASLIARGAGPDRSAFLSAFFSLVGLHGLHVATGLCWLVFIVAQFLRRGPRDYVRRRLHCFTLFWHALDIVWVGVFTLVYLIGIET